MENEQELIEPKKMTAKYRVIVRDEADKTSMSFGVYSFEYDKRGLREMLKEYLEEQDGV